MVYSFKKIMNKKNLGVCEITFVVRPKFFHFYSILSLDLRILGVDKINLIQHPNSRENLGVSNCFFCLRPSCKKLGH